MILDCTFRDGGYYVDWDFDESLVNKYLQAIEISKIDIVEMGFRFIPKDKFLGASAYTSDDYLNSLQLPKSVNIAVMVNADELINYKDGLNEAVKLLFNKKIDSPVDIVRIAAHVKDINSCKDLVSLLKNLGYRVCLNIMQVDSLKFENLTDIAKIISDWNSVEVLYFADSFGNMNSESVENTILAIKSGWSGNIGFHAHNNKGQALINCLTALKSGVSYIDSTIFGMGRGAGNVKTEILLIEMSLRGYGDYNAKGVFDIAVNQFQKLYDIHKWGPNIYYHLSAIYGIHPTYIQEMLSDDRYKNSDIISSIEFLKNINTASYNSENLTTASQGLDGDEHGSWSAKDLFKNQDILIIGSGESAKKYLKPIIQYINKKKPLVFSLNFNDPSFLPNENIDFYIACNDLRILMDSNNYKNLGKPIIMPISRLSKNIKESFANINVLDFGLRLDKKSFKIFENGCILNKPLALSYALSIASAGGANRILLAGIDGYDALDTRQQDMINLFFTYLNSKEALPVLAITPTNLPIKKSSIFKPLL